MAGLSRNVRTPRLLSIVNHKAHATAEDHEELPPRSTRTQDDDPTREPDSSSDDEIIRFDSTAKPSQKIPASNTRPDRLYKSQQPKQTVSRNAKNVGQASKSPPDRRAEDDIFADSERAFKRQKTTYVRNEANSKPKSVLQYGKSAKRASAQKAKDNKAAVFQRPQGVDKEVRKAQQPKFKHLEDVPIEQPSFSLPSGVSTDPTSSLECDGLDLDDPDMVDGSDGLEEDSADRCDSCHAKVDPMAKENFEIENDLGKKWTYKWQLRFCEYHQRHDAEKIWRESKYPDIDWQKLPGRLRAASRVRRIEKILRGEQRSIFQDDQEKAVKSGKHTLQQFMTADANDTDKARAGAGYYGYRGEKIIIEHVMQQFSNDLRTRSTRDKIFAAAGLAGGMSGFVSGVLVPELAATLIAEDLKCTDDMAVEIVRSSADLGDLLNPEQDDKTTVEAIKLND